MNICTENVQETSAFYQAIFGLSRINDAEHTLAGADTEDRFEGMVDFLTDGAVEFHITKKDVNLGFQMKQFINPLERGHFCFRTDDIEGFKQRLEAQQIPYADYGKWALAGWHQIFFHDPNGYIIEVHQTGL
jgi:catechol 2,3-dioxygenase-like lactoylglutathione lyase family enzyme